MKFIYVILNIFQLFHYSNFVKYYKKNKIFYFNRQKYFIIIIKKKSQNNQSSYLIKITIIHKT